MDSHPSRAQHRAHSMRSINPNFLDLSDYLSTQTLDLRVSFLAPQEPSCVGTGCGGCTAWRWQGPWGRGEGGGKKGERIPEIRKAWRTQGPGWKPRLFTALPSGCGRAGARGLGDGARRPARCPRPPGHGPGRRAPPRPVLAAPAGWLGPRSQGGVRPWAGCRCTRVGVVRPRVAGPGAGEVLRGGVRPGGAGPGAGAGTGGGLAARGVGCGVAGRPWAPGGPSGLLQAAVWLRLRSREEKGRRRKGSFLKAEAEER